VPDDTVFVLPASAVFAAISPVAALDSEFLSKVRAVRGEAREVAPNTTIEFKLVLPN
jgi:hypothetical protein